MRLRLTSLRPAGLRLTALALLVWSLLLPVAPMLEASIGAMVDDGHACCRRGGTCCHRKGSTGPAWNPAPECGSRCVQGPGAVPVFQTPASFAFSSPDFAPESAVAPELGHLPSLSSAFLRQRPPPRP